MSNINPNNIDGTYPIAGQDNDSQGFRDNFTNIKNNFTFAADEIDDLRGKVVVKSALSGTTIDNDMGGSILSNATIENISETRETLGTVSGAVTLNHANGHYQTATTGGSITSITFSGFTNGKVGRIRLELNVTDTAYTLTLPAAVSIGADSLTGATGNVVTFPSTGKYIYEFTSDDGAVTVAVSEVATPVDSGNYVLTSVATTTSSSLSNIGLGFAAKANGVYKFEALIPFSHSATGTDTHTFSVNFSAGNCVAFIGQQAGPTSTLTYDTITVSDDTGSNVTTSSTSTKMCIIRGTFTHTADTTVALRFATSAGTLTVLAGANLAVTRLA